MSTFVACLTPPGTAALATLAVRGPRAWEIVRGLFRPHSSKVQLPDEPRPGQVWLGRFGGETADDVVLSARRAGPAPWVEVHCHGGREVIAMLLEAVEAKGASVCTWQELEQQTDDDPLRALAAAALAEAPTVRTAAILLDQYHGAFGREVGAILAALASADVRRAADGLERLARNHVLGRHLTQPWRVAVVGAPNVGKSSLINALAGYQRSIVAATPGTTRDVVTTQIAVDGWPVELADTAGLRSGGEALEEAGVALAREAAAAADLCLWVLDSSTAPIRPERFAHPTKLVINKIDLPAAWDVDAFPGAIRVSALTSAGIPGLCQALAGWLVPEPPPAGSAVPFTPRLCDLVEAARTRLQAGLVPDAVRALQLSFDTSSTR